MYIKQLTKETVIYGISGVMSKFIMVFLVPIYTRIFSPEDYGIISIVNTTMIFVNIFIVAGLDSAAHRWYWDCDDENYKKSTIATWFWFQLFLSIVICLFFIFLSNHLSKIFFKKVENSIYFKIIAFYFPFSVTNTVVLNLFRMRRQAWPCFWYSMVFSLFNIFVSIICVVILKLNVRGVFYAQVLTAFTNTIFSIFVLKSWISPTFFTPGFLKMMLKYASPLIPASLAYWVVNLSGTYFINFLSETEQVGFYQVGSTIASGVGLITGAFQQAIGPFSLSILKENDAKKIYADVFMLYIIIICLICLSFNLFSKEVLVILTTKKYSESHKVIPLLTYTYVAISLSYIAMIGCTIVKVTKYYAEAVILSALISIILYLLLIPQLGIIGAAVSSLISQFVTVIYIFKKSQKLYFIPYDFKGAIFITLLSFVLSIAGSNIKLENYFFVISLKVFLFFSFLTIIYLDKRYRNYFNKFYTFLSQNLSKVVEK